MKKITNEIKREILEKILASNEFKESELYTELLSYLVDLSIKNEQPKAISIAIDVFQKDGNHKDISESATRSYISRLRKKLEKYYSDEGKYEKIKVNIPKGHYNVTFNKNRQIKKIKLNHILSITTIILLIISISLFYQLNVLTSESNIEIKSGNNNTDIYKNDPIWSDIFSSDLPTKIVLGEELLYEEVIEDRYEDLVLVKNFQINREIEFNDYIKSHPDYNISQITTWPFFADNCIYGLLNIYPIFVTSGLNYNFIRSRNYFEGNQNFSNENLLFLGGYRTLITLRKVLKRIPLIIYPEFQVFPDSSDPDSNFSYMWEILPFSPDHYDDYCIFLKFPGPKNNCIMIYTSYHGLGIRAATEYTTDISKLKEFQDIIKEKNKYVPQYFISVFKVMGTNEIPYKISVEYFQEIDPNINLWE